MVNVKATQSYYETLVKEARLIVSKLRGVGVKAYITGGLALDKFTNQARSHNDIDIFIDGFSNDLVGKVDSIMRSLGYECVFWGGRKDGSVGILTYEKEIGVVTIDVDFFFKSFNAILPYFGEVIPYSKDDYYLNEVLVFVHYTLGAGFSFGSSKKDVQRLNELLAYLKREGKL